MLYAPSGLGSHIGYPVENVDYTNAFVCTIPYVIPQVLRRHVPIYDNNDNSYSTPSLYKSPRLLQMAQVQMHVVKKEVKAEATKILELMQNVHKTIARDIRKERRMGLRGRGNVLLHILL